MAGSIRRIDPLSSTAFMVCHGVVRAVASRFRFIPCRSRRCNVRLDYLKTQGSRSDELLP